MVLELNSGEGVTLTGLEVAPGPCGALRPAHGERSGVRRLGTDGVVEKQRWCGGDGLPEEGSSGARTKYTGKVPFIAVWAEGGWGGRDGSALVASAQPRYESGTCTRGRR
jgi:hypothetical protein